LIFLVFNIGLWVVVMAVAVAGLHVTVVDQVQWRRGKSRVPKHGKFVPEPGLPSSAGQAILTSFQVAPWLSVSVSSILKAQGMAQILG
jgi:hypothetical protein